MKRKSARKASKPDEPVAIPASLDTQAFRERWQMFIDHRRDTIKKPLTPDGTKLLLRQLEAFGPEWAANRIEEAIIGKWQGLIFSEDRQAKSQTKASGGKTGSDDWGISSKPVRPTPEHVAALFASAEKEIA
jgi:hypothetical protein